eukprot:Platyproteum_vivax@DN6289_c0_g1_i2.p1
MLSERQHKDLRSAVFQYLQTECPSAAVSMVHSFGKVEIPTHEKVLEKKWLAVLKLQIQVMELENHMETLKESLAAKLSAQKLSQPEEGLPSSDKKQHLVGHRSSVTRVLFHPVFAVLLSASEDGSIKIWDYEGLTEERSLKQHTHAVNGLALDTTGHLMASCSSDLSVKLWDFSGNIDCIRTMNGHDQAVSVTDKDSL